MTMVTMEVLLMVVMVLMLTWMMARGMLMLVDVVIECGHEF